MIGSTDGRAPICAPGEDEITRFLYVLLIIYFLEMGAVLVIVPWTTYWDRNYFIERSLLEAVLTSHVVRGGVTGVGFFSIGVAVVEMSITFQRLIARWLEARAGGSVLADAARHS